MSNDDLIVKIKADIRSLQAGLRQAAREADIAGKKMQDGIGRSGAAVALDSIRRGASSAASALGGLRGVIVTLGVAKLGKDAVAAAAGFDSLKASLTLILGSSDAATAAIADMRAQAERLGVNVVSLTQGFTRFSAAANGTALEGSAARDVYLAVNEAMARMGLSTEQTEGALLALEQIMSKGTVQAEELRGQLGERIPGAFNIAARAMGVTTQELGDLLKQGKVVADEFLPKFAQELRNTFSTTETTRIATMRSEFERVKNVINEIQIEVGTPLARAFANAGQEFLKFVDNRKAQVIASDFRVAAQNVDYYRERLEVAKKLPLTGLVEDMSRALEKAEADFKKASEARDQFVRSAIDRAIGVVVPSAPTGAPVDVPMRAGPGEDLDEVKKEQKKQAQLAEQREEAIKAMQEANRRIVEGIRERVADETELENIRYSAQRAALETINDQTIISTEEKNRFLLQMEEQHAAKLAEITARNAADAQAELESERALQMEKLQAQTEFAAAMGDIEAEMRLRAELEYQYQLDLLSQFEEDKVAVLMETNTLREQIERDHWARLAGIQVDALNSQFSFMKFAKTKEQAYTAALGDKALAAWSTQSKRMFEINKMLNLGNTTVNTSSAVMKAWSQGGIFAAPMAALIAATGLANINAIKNAKFGGGSSPPVTGAAAAGGGVVGDTNAPVAAPQIPQISLTLVGGQFSQQQVRALIDQINEAYRDGAPRG